MISNLLKPSQETIKLLNAVVNSAREISLAHFEVNEIDTVEKWVSNVIHVAKYLTNIDFDLYPDISRAEINQAAGNFIRYGISMEKVMNIPGGRAYSQFSTAYFDFISAVNRIVPINIANNTLMSNLQDANLTINGLLSQAETSAESSRLVEERMNQKIEEMEAIVASTKKAAQEVVVAKYTTIFNTFSNKHRNSAGLWLFACIFIVISLCVFSLLIFEHSVDFIHKNADIIQYPATMVIWIGSRVAIYSTLFVALSVCVSNYKANKHNQIVNRHRQNALNTFETFVRASGDDKTMKDAILMEVTRTIFGAQSTGFSSSDNDGETRNKIVEIVKNISSEK